LSGRKPLSRIVYVLIDNKLITKSVEGVITEEYARLSSERKRNPFSGYGSDQLGGVEGILNHADGKKYDSKSQFNRAVRTKGCRIVGNDWNNAEYKTPLERGVRGDFNVRPQLKEAIQKVVGC
jgi:hypothetical protein